MGLKSRIITSAFGGRIGLVKSLVSSGSGTLLHWGRRSEFCGLPIYFCAPTLPPVAPGLHLFTVRLACSIKRSDIHRALNLLGPRP